ncbi:hypothetical protein L6654_41635 [Bradyrhizobium sp. WYCCWR 13023]|uniref:Uncharacterized protein n=1 Tax=Bradyrhizobium zhengyangense TaxID=2911009 RepID=A0A9X1UD14_9BRAD|nr:hypothetical protein [Bradyrhizobium zhengyangense]MCG2633061.1 hypothetical protein [Bradyrhizobium zhengyangense]
MNLTVSRRGERPVDFAVKVRKHVFNCSDGLLNCRELPQLLITNLTHAVLQRNDHLASPFL